jgi:phosphate transport system substrate-binding protein
LSKAAPVQIGYLELSYAKDAGLPVAAIENRAGEFVTPSPASATLAINAYEQTLIQDLRTPVVDPAASAKGAYPIAGLSFILIPKENKTPGEQKAFKKFISYCLTDGQNTAEEMSYSRLPPPLLQEGASMLTQLKD